MRWPAISRWSLRLVEERPRPERQPASSVRRQPGTLLASFAFMRDGIASRLLGTIGHADLGLFARSYTPRFAPLLANPPVRAAARLFSRLTGRKQAEASVKFLSILRKLCGRTEHLPQCQPDDLPRASRARKASSFPGGRKGPGGPIAGCERCASRFPDGESVCASPISPTAATRSSDTCRTFLGTQLGDWRW